MLAAGGCRVKNALLRFAAALRVTSRPSTGERSSAPGSAVIDGLLSGLDLFLGRHQDDHPRCPEAALIDGERGRGGALVVRQFADNVSVDFTRHRPAISLTSLCTIASPKLLKSSIGTTNAPVPPMTFSR